MKGPQGLASESHGRRCRTAKTRSRRVGESFYVLLPEIEPPRGGSQTVPLRKERTHGCGVLRVTLDSDVTHEMKASANAGTSVAAALGRAVPGLVSRVLQTP
jgi:hypothetical protein